jgi:hypothetical protein
MHIDKTMLLTVALPAVAIGIFWAFIQGNPVWAVPFLLFAAIFCIKRRPTPGADEEPSSSVEN